MAVDNLALFKPGAPPSERAQSEQRARREEAERLRALLLDRDHTSEIFAAMVGGNSDPDDLMPTPDVVAARWGNGDYQIYEDMRRNVPIYGALQQGATDVVLSLPITWLPGQKGDAESEEAAAAIAAAWENIDERQIALNEWCSGFETGFAPVENVWGRHVRGKARDLVSIVAFINRPISWFGFDYLHRPRFKPGYATWKGSASELVSPYKVSFLRSGSLHSPYGKGTGQFCYPAVWTIDKLARGYLALTERFGFMPAVITYPNIWKTPRVAALREVMEAQWKNVLLMPGEVDEPKVAFPSTDAAYAAANASGQSRMAMIKLYTEWLALFVQGSMYSSATSTTGAYARDKIADSARLYRAAANASCIEATLNRGFVRPTMLVNYPTLEESKWPRCAIDAAPGEDLELLLRIFESGSKLKVPIAAVTWSERFKIPLAASGQQVLETAQPAVAPSAIDTGDATMFGEQNIVTIHGADGRAYEYPSDVPVYIEGKGIVRAGMVGRGDVMVDDPTRLHVA